MATTKHNTTFEGWLRLVDVHLVHLIGMSYDDCEDWNWHDAYSEGTIPFDAAREFIEDVFPSLMIDDEEE